MKTMGIKMGRQSCEGRKEAEGDTKAVKYEQMKTMGRQSCEEGRRQKEI
jgi:hypothetical protein